MAMKKYNPTTASRRFMSVVSREEITKQRPEKSLVEGVKKRTGGRNSVGQISSRFHRRRSEASLPEHRFQAG
jgi:large subunit ribosomal protein L2